MMHIFISAAGDDIRPGATGKAVPGYEATVLDPANQPLIEGEGRLAIKGPTGCRYLDDPRQADYVVDGWNVTGDTYRRDAAGYYWYVARSDDMIVSSGYNIGAPEWKMPAVHRRSPNARHLVSVRERGEGKAFVVAAAYVNLRMSLAELQAQAKAQIALNIGREMSFVNAACPRRDR